MLKITGLYTYPVKSLGGVALQEATVVERGFEHDRRWMIVDENNRFLTQRELPRMALLQARVENESLVIAENGNDGIAWSGNILSTSGLPITVEIFDEFCDALPVSGEADQWLSGRLETSCRLVLMPDSSRRPVDSQYAPGGEITSFTDGYPFLLVGEASLETLNAQLPAPVLMNRFRPSIVISGSAPHAEDGLGKFTIGAISFTGVKNCGRCTITTVNQESGETGKEPLRTLAGYRTRGRKVLFGRYLVHAGTGKIRLGDALENAEF